MLQLLCQATSQIVSIRTTMAELKWKRNHNNLCFLCRWIIKRCSSSASSIICLLNGQGDYWYPAFSATISPKRTVTKIEIRHHISMLQSSFSFLEKKLKPNVKLSKYRQGLATLPYLFTATVTIFRGVHALRPQICFRKRIIEEMRHNLLAVEIMAPKQLIWLDTWPAGKSQ